jgi:hypothetical protein
MKSIALALSAVAVILMCILLWQQRDIVQTGERVTREAHLSLWHPAIDLSVD